MTLSDQPSYQGAVKGTVTYGVAGAPTIISIGQLQFVRPERTFPADCAAARLRLEAPELHFAQLDPFNEKRMVRALIVRFERGRFVERIKANEKFRLELEEKLAQPITQGTDHRAPRQVGRLTRIFEEAAFVGDPPLTAIVDAEFDLVSYSNGRAGMIFLVTSQNQLASALIARAEEIPFDPALEVTMTIGLLADLLLSWKNLGETIT
jgi:hypothetical protein